MPPMTDPRDQRVVDHGDWFLARCEEELRKKRRQIGPRLPIDRQTSLAAMEAVLAALAGLFEAGLGEGARRNFRRAVVPRSCIV